jgi:hypothetical protein
VRLRQNWSAASGVRKTIAKKIPARGLTARQFDFTAKLKGWAEFGGVMSDELAALGDGSFVLCNDYQQTAEMAFYTRGQPKTYFAGSYWHDRPGRMTQYDVWPDRDLGPASPLVGKNAIFLGHHSRPFPDLLKAFDRVEGVLTPVERVVDGKPVRAMEHWAVVVPVARQGTVVQEFKYLRCYGFKGLTRPPIETIPR